MRSKPVITFEPFTMRELFSEYYLIILLIFVCSFFGCKKDEANNSNISSYIPSPQDQSFIKQILSIDSLSKVTQDQKTAIDQILTIQNSPDFQSQSAFSKSFSFHKLGVLAYRSYNFEQAIEYLDDAIKLRQSISEFGNTEIEKSYYVRALSFNEEIKHKEAIADLNATINISKEKGTNQKKLGAYYSLLGKFYSYDKEFIKAQEYFDQARALLTLGSWEEAEFYDFYGQFLSAKKSNDEAIFSYQKSIDLFSKLENTLGYVYPVKRNLIAVQNLKLDYQQAIENFNKLLIEMDTFDHSFDRIRYNCLNGLGLLHIKNNNGSAALISYKSLLEYAKKFSNSKNTIDIARGYEGIGDAYEVLGEYDKSIENYHAAIKALSIGFESDDYYALPSLENHVILSQSELERILGFKADAIHNKFVKSQKLTDLKELFEAYKLQDKLLTKIRQGYKAAASRYDLVTAMIPFYQKATEASLLLYEKTGEQKYLNEAYNFASKNKAIVLLDGMQNEAAKFSGIPADILQQENNLKNEIYKLENKIFALRRSNVADSDEALKQLIEDRFSKTRDYENLVARLEKNYPNYFQLKYATKKNIDVNQLSESLPDQTAVIEYFVTSNKLFTFVVTKKSGLQYFVQNRPEKFGTRCKEFRQLSEKDSVSNVNEFNDLAYGLYQSILQQPLEHIEKKETIDRLIIIPDDYLMQISFDALMHDSLTSANVSWTSDLPYLMKKYAISYAYNNQLIFDNGSNKRIANAKGGYVGFGLEYDDYTLNALNGLLQSENINTSNNRGMGKLFYSDDEVRESLEVFGGQAFINEHAVKENFINAAPSANLLHIVTHGFVSKDKPLSSGLVLTKTKKTTDFILNASEFYSMKLQADMAVLSACHTGDGKIQKGEGIRSLARAFNYAGCPNVTASLWGAPDLSTKEIILPFFKQLKAGQPKDQALKNAKLTYLNNCAFDKEALPCNWAHLVTIGDASQIYLK